MSRWTSTGSFSVARGRHSAIVLHDGRVLVCGAGWNIAELYDPSTGTWTRTGSTVHPRLGPATLLQNDRVLLTAGGPLFLNLADPHGADLYDPAAGEWSPTGNLIHARQLHTLTLLLNGEVLAASGETSAAGMYNSAELYAPVSQVWTRTGDLHFARHFHTATLLNDGRVLVVGGVTGDPETENTAEVYDPAAGQWTLTGSMFYSRWAGHTATRLEDGKVLVAGGLIDTALGYGASPATDSVEMYDPASGNWYSVGRLTTARAGHAATLLYDGKVLVEGGSALGFSALPLSSAEVYNPATFTWTPAASLTVTRIEHAATLLKQSRFDGGLPGRPSRVLVTGGLRDSVNGLLNTCEIGEFGDDMVVQP